jgi:hypothetical protein
VSKAEPLQKHTLNLFEGDMEELRDLYPDVDPTVLIRNLVRQCIKQAKSQDPAGVDKLKLPVNL